MRHSTKVRKESKTERVLEHLQHNGSITSWEAIEEYGATRLSAIIFNLRKNHKIRSEDSTFTDRYGYQSTYTRYVYCGAL